MSTHSVQHPFAGVSPVLRGSPHTRRLWLASFIVFVTALSTAALLWVARSSSADASANTASLDAPIGVVRSFAQRRTHNSRYSVEVIAASPVAVGLPATWTVHIARRVDRVAHASVQAQVWMPETAERSPARTRIQYVGGGNYRVENVLFARAGWWNVALVIAGRSGTDSVAFNVIIPPQLPEKAHTSDAPRMSAPVLTRTRHPLDARKYQNAALML